MGVEQCTQPERIPQLKRMVYSFKRLTSIRKSGSTDVVGRRCMVSSTSALLLLLLLPLCVEVVDDAAILIQ